jgi:hypothetical protein
MAFDWLVKWSWIILIFVCVLTAMILFFLAFRPSIEGGIFSFIFNLFRWLSQPVV